MLELDAVLIQDGSGHDEAFAMIAGSLFRDLDFGLLARASLREDRCS